MQYDKKLADDLADIRNNLLHGKDYESEYDELLRGENKLYGLLDRIILNMIGWKGQDYISRVNDYRATTL